MENKCKKIDEIRQNPTKEWLNFIYDEIKKLEELIITTNSDISSIENENSPRKEELIRTRKRLETVESELKEYQRLKNEIYKIINENKLIVDDLMKSKK